MLDVLGGYVTGLHGWTFGRKDTRDLSFSLCLFFFILDLSLYPNRFVDFALPHKLFSVECRSSIYRVTTSIAMEWRHNEGT